MRLTLKVTAMGLRVHAFHPMQYRHVRKVFFMHLLLSVLDSSR